MSSRLFISTMTIAVCLSLSLQAQTPAEPVLKAELVVCTSVVERTPQGADTTFALAVDSLYCWTRITESTEETTITHVWLHEGDVMAQVELPVRSSYWRTWSIKKFYGKSGNWEVKVIDATGNTLGRVSFTVTP